MPVVFNEPLSFIQRISEYMAYAPLIEKATDTADPIERMMVTYFVFFSPSLYAGTDFHVIERT